MPKAIKDIDKVHDYIAEDLFSPVTARKYKRGIYQTIRKLAFIGDMYPVNYTDSLQRQYGPEVRTITYKKMTIIYTVIDDLVLVHSVTAGSLIV